VGRHHGRRQSRLRQTSKAVTRKSPKAPSLTQTSKASQRKKDQTSKTPKAAQIYSRPTSPSTAKACGTISRVGADSFAMGLKIAA